VPSYAELGFPDLVIDESSSLSAPAAVAPETTTTHLVALAYQMLALPETPARFSIRA